MTNTCQHARNDGRTIVSAQLTCNKCHAVLPFPRTPDKCGHSHAHEVVNGVRTCHECGASF
jgi:hypothetical protein